MEGVDKEIEAPRLRSEDQHEGSKSEENNTSKSWIVEVEERYRSQHYKWRLPSSHVCIYRVPELLIRCRPEAYHPEFASFGPFHHNKHQGLSTMENYKLKAVHKTIERLMDKSIEDLLRVIKVLEKKIRDCYEDSAIEYDRETLAWMMMMDGCFILEFLRASCTEGNGKEFSLIFPYANLNNLIQVRILMDILKLENQIPLLILISILELELQTYNNAVSELINILYGIHMFRSYPFSWETADKIRPCNNTILRMEEYIKGGACHLLDLCRQMTTNFLTQSSPVPATTAESSSASVSDITTERTLFVSKCVPSSSPTFRCNLLTWLRSSFVMNVSHWLRGREQTGLASCDSAMPRAELLHMAGIQFKTCVDGNLRFRKRTFGRSTLFLPPILVEGITETMLRNLIVFEEYERLKGKMNVFSHYMWFMNKLIDSEKDVSLLSKEGIIINLIGSDEEVATLFNNVDKGTTTGEFKQFSEVAQQVKAEYKSKLKVWMSQFLEEHCSKPWYILSLLAAILILVMTAIQTVYSVKK